MQQETTAEAEHKETTAEAEHISIITKTAFHLLIAEHDRNGTIPNLFYTKESGVMAYCLRFGESYHHLTTNATLFACEKGQYLLDTCTFFATEPYAHQTPGFHGAPLFTLLPVPVNAGYQLQLPIETDDIHEALRISLGLYIEHWESIVKHVVTGKTASPVE